MAGSPQTSTIQNPDGSTTSVAVSWTAPPPPPTPMRIGNAAGAAPGKPPEFVIYPSTVCTLFNAPGAGLNVNAIKALPAGVHPIVCVKDTYPAVAAQLQAAAGLGIPFDIVHHHEPEADMPAAQYVAEVNAYADAIEAWPHIGLGCKLLGYSENQVGADYRKWITRRETWVGLDNYSQDLTAYPDPAKFIALLQQMSDYAGVLGALTEFMALRVKTDTDGSGRAAWIVKVVTACRRAGFVYALPWVGLGSKSKTYPGGIPFGPFAPSSPEYGATLALITNQ